jgi:hypothetical protein
MTVPMRLTGVAIARSECALQPSPTRHEIWRSLVTTNATELQWRHDVDEAIADATRTHRPVLLDFTAAPQ